LAFVRKEGVALQIGRRSRGIFTLIFFQNKSETHEKYLTQAGFPLEMAILCALRMLYYE
jgi:hypothetical protein